MRKTNSLWFIVPAAFCLLAGRPARAVSSHTTPNGLFRLDYYGAGESFTGKWYDENGKQTYKATLQWKQDAYGWWVEDTNGWYPVSSWQKIDGKWYYFCSDGYMDYSEYRDGCWLGSDGAWVEAYSGGRWGYNEIGWWYQDSTGWYPCSRWLWIDGSCYWFNANGYME